MAPFFVVVEVMIYVFDYRKADLDAFNRIVRADIAYYRQSKGIPMMKGMKIAE